jgi:tetratricopeptide (TPR) repeat protein
MADEGFKRKLAAILSADVEGYSRLMDDDEEATVRTLKAYRAAINDLVQQYRGRIVDSPGDNILAEFGSVVDATDGKHLWSERYDRNFKDIFDLQDEITIKIVNSLRVKLLEGEDKVIWLNNWPNNLQYTELILQARYYLGQWNKEANIEAKQLYREAIKLEPNHFGGYVGLAYTHFVDVHLRLSTSPRVSLAEAVKLCKKAIEYKPKNLINHHALAGTYALAGRYEEAQEAWSEVLKLDPKMTVEKMFPKRWPYGQEHRERQIAALRKAGLK